MFPPSLQKNIRELDRQISLLETECENMEAENRDSSPGKINSKPTVRETPNKLSNPNNCPSAGHSPKILNLAPMRTHPSNPSQSKGTNDVVRGLADAQIPESMTRSRGSEKKESGEGSEGSRHGSKDRGLENESKQIGEKKEMFSVDAKKSCRPSMESLREVTESSEDNYPIRIEINNFKQKINSMEKSKEQKIWCELSKEHVLSDKRQDRKTNKKILDNRESLERNPAEPRFSSDEELSKTRRFADSESKSRNEKWSREVERPVTPHSKTSSKRRPRSARTRKNSDEVPLDVNIITKAIHEKDIQCIMWNEEREKAEFLLNLNESIRTLHLLIEELKTKSSREKRNDLLNDMQNTLMKIGGLKSMNALHSSLIGSPQSKGNNAKPLEGEESVVDLKKALLTVKKFCQELSEEKSALTEELSTKNGTITSLKSKEKEYLALISNLKFNLERLREEVEEGQLAKRELSVVKGKLREEAKVIEALKKSHGKMQALIEHYVLENDKLRAEVKLAKLESQKFHVLLAGKEAEISKRKQEIELFQRQITQQLSLLRSKATENEVDRAIEAISNQTNILQTEVDSLPSETTFDKGEPSVAFDMMETTSPNRTRTESPKKDERPSFRGGGMGVPGERGERETESVRLSSSSRDMKEAGEEEEKKKVEGGGMTSWKSEDSIPEVGVGDRPGYNLGLRGVLSSSKSLRSSINEMLQGIRRGSAEKFWPSPPNSSNTSLCSLPSSCSENVP